MAVYVDDVRHGFGRMVMCHMWADSLEELLTMADRIGVARRWLQQPPKASWVHFDIALGKKALAIRNGAILTDRYEPVAFEARRKITEIDSVIARIEKEIADGADPDEAGPPAQVSRSLRLEQLIQHRGKCEEKVKTVAMIRARESKASPANGVDSGSRSDTDEPRGPTQGSFEL